MKKSRSRWNPRGHRVCKKWKSDPDNRKPRGTLPLMAGGQILSIHRHTNRAGKKWHLIVLLPSPRAPSLFISSSLRLPLLHYGFLSWINIFLLPRQPPAFFFSRWRQTIFCNGQLKVIRFMSDYDGVFPKLPSDLKASFKCSNSDGRNICTILDLWWNTVSVKYALKRRSTKSSPT